MDSSPWVQMKCSGLAEGCYAECPAQGMDFQELLTKQSQHKSLWKLPPKDTVSLLFMDVKDRKVVLCIKRKIWATEG